jgi:hypothetical protein
MPWQNAPMSALQRLVALLVGLLVVVGVAALGLNVAGGGSGSTASPSAGPSRSASPSDRGSEQPPASVDASPDDEDTLAILREIEEQVVEIRGLPAADIGPPEIITRAELADELEQLFEEEYPPEDQERDNIALRALGLLEPGQDVAELQLQLLGDQVLGFYDDVERRMVVVSDAGLDPEAKLTYAHEYTHALQDAAFGLDSLETDEVGEDDRALARTAMIEGDATVTMLAWAFAYLTPEELMQIGTGAVPDTSGIPSWMVEQLQFPYNEGALWAGALTVNPTQPDFDALDAAYDDPPDSTEQIIDVAAWPHGDEPVSIETLDLAAALGDGWSEVDATPIGQASIEIMLAYLGVQRSVATEAADGWGGDEAVIASGPDDAFAVAWRLAWDAPSDADEFVDAYETAIETLDFPATVVTLPGGDVLVVHASSEALLDEVLAAAAR